MANAGLELRRRKVDELRGKRERRVFDGAIELRDAGGGQIGLVGWACRTNTQYEVGSLDRGGFVEEVRSGAFRRSLGNDPDTILVLEHGRAGSGLPIARTRSGTLRLSEDALGLKVDADLDADDPDVQTLKRKMDRGDLDGQMSFAFWVPDGGDKWSSDFTRRTITQAEIHQGDVSVVTFASSPTTSSTLVARAALLTARPLVSNSRRDRERLILLASRDAARKRVA